LLFHSYPFLFAFLPAVLAGLAVAAARRRARFGRLFLLLASLLFYAWWRWSFVPLLAASVLFNFCCCAALWRGRERDWPARRRRAVAGVAVAADLALLGYFKYARFFAEALAPLAVADAWGGGLAFTLQIYFDFSGYSDMAIGLGRMVGVRLPENFDSPYKATSIAEFWRRWHMTLSTFLRDYLYIPLGGNRCGAARRRFNLMATMLLGGLWHGANWTFLVWGGVHGLYLLAGRAWQRRGFPLPRPLAWALTFTAVLLGLVVFRADSLHHALLLLGCLTGLDGAVDQEAGWEKFQDWKRRLVGVAGPLWDFSGYNDLGCDERFFFDFLHLGPAAGQAVLRHLLGLGCAACGELTGALEDAARSVSADNLDRHLARQEEERGRRRDECRRPPRLPEETVAQGNL
jgi:D-alanyl-lipoteichoic acid acyltransferase DltB (MBOAT superfamily)